VIDRRAVAAAAIASDASASAAHASTAPAPARSAGFTIAEMVIVCALLTILAGITMPVTKYTFQRLKEAELRTALRQMRNAIDEHKRYSDAGLLPLELGTDGYPKDLEKLVDGVEVVGQLDRKIKFLRRIPVDPFTGKAEWSLRSYQDKIDADEWGGEDVYDVHSLSHRRGINGIPYDQW
jgi:general secretion pathway protein G